MAHIWQENENGETDFWAMNPFGSNHHGPVCTNCGVQFCIECSPELMDSDCTWFLPSESTTDPA